MAASLRGRAPQPIALDGGGASRGSPEQPSRALGTQRSRTGQLAPYRSWGRGPVKALGAADAISPAAAGTASGPEGRYGGTPGPTATQGLSELVPTGALADPGPPASTYLSSERTYEVPRPLERFVGDVSAAGDIGGLGAKRASDGFRRRRPPSP